MVGDLRYSDIILKAVYNHWKNCFIPTTSSGSRFFAVFAGNSGYELKNSIITHNKFNNNGLSKDIGAIIFLVVGKLNGLNICYNEFYGASNNNGGSAVTLFSFVGMNTIHFFNVRIYNNYFYDNYYGIYAELNLTIIDNVFINN